jgi:hypothetical protein
VRDIFAGVELELKPLGAGFAKACPRIAAETGLNCVRKPEVEHIVGVQMGELSPGNGPCGATWRPEARRRLLNLGESGECGAKLLDGPHSNLL